MYSKKKHCPEDQERMTNPKKTSAWEPMKMGVQFCNIAVLDYYFMNSQSLHFLSCCNGGPVGSS